MQQEEIWKDIKGWEGYYQISNLARVKSLERKQRFVSMAGKECFYVKKEMIKKSVINKVNGYRMISFSRNSKAYTTYIHKLVAEHFIPNPSNLPWINHKDGNKLNNSLDNLEWCTPAENILHARTTGLQAVAIGSNVGASKLDELQVKVIKTILSTKDLTTMAQLARHFKVAFSTIHKIQKGETWNHVTLTGLN